MSTMDDDHDDLAAMINSLGLDSIEMADGEGNVQDLNARDLLTEYSGIGVKLAEMGEVIEPKTQEGRDLHSRYFTLKAELIRRGLM